MNDLIVTDSLPAGMRLDGWQLLTRAGDATFIEKDFNGNVTDPIRRTRSSREWACQRSHVYIQPTLLLNVGEDGNPDITDNLFAIRLTTTVLNVSGNQNGTAITNTASASIRQQCRRHGSRDANPR